MKKRCTYKCEECRDDGDKPGENTCTFTTDGAVEIYPPMWCPISANGAVAFKAEVVKWKRVPEPVKVNMPTLPPAHGGYPFSKPNPKKFSTSAPFKFPKFMTDPARPEWAQ